MEQTSDPAPLPVMALDVSLEKARALHRVWRALNDGDCPYCHTYRPATEMIRNPPYAHVAVQCPDCRFGVTFEEIEAIEKMFAPAMDAAVAIFQKWRDERADVQSSTTSKGTE